MNVIRGLVLTLGAATLMVAAAACGDDVPPQTRDAPGVSTASSVPASPLGRRQPASPASSGSMIPRHASVEALIARSQIIVVGTIDESFEQKMLGGYGPDGQASTAPEGAMAFTDYRINIEEVLKGDGAVSADTRSVVLRMFGHLNAQQTAVTSVMFKLPEPGDHLLFALGRNPDGTYGSGPEGLINVDSAGAVYADGVPFATGGTTAELLEQIRSGVPK